MKILIAGTGAVGSVFGCLLANAGHEVTALGRGEHLARIAAAGVRVTGIWGEHTSRALRATENAAELGRDFDAILVACKTFQADELLAAVGDRLAPDGSAISLQNGLGNVERLCRVFGAERSLAARVIFGAVVERPGEVRVTVEAAPVLLGRLGDQRSAAPGGTAEPDPSAVYWAGIFDGAGISCGASGQVEAALWGKVFYNAALNPMGALLSLSYGELAQDPLRRTVMERVIGEAYAVAVAEGVRMPWASASEYARVFFEELLPPTRGHRSSMLQDLERGKPTEIDAICGEVVRRGDIHAIDVSVNRALLALVKGRERRR